VVATGRSDYPNQINNVLASPASSAACSTPGVSDFTDEMLIAAAHAIADKVLPDELNSSYIVPSVFDASVAPAVAAAVSSASPRSTSPSSPTVTAGLTFTAEVDVRPEIELPDYQRHRGHGGRRRGDRRRRRRAAREPALALRLAEPGRARGRDRATSSPWT
jgi:hypothetical protein